jgi:4-hydroxybenzoate polyprenyltransferase
VRFREWWDKLLHVGGAAFLLRSFGQEAGTGGYSFAVYVAGVACFLAGGYAINEAADFSRDRISGRDGSGEIIDRRHCLVLALVAIASGMLFLLSTGNDTPPLVIAVATVIIGVEYSLPPLRLKERGISGVITGAVTQRPALFLIFVAMQGTWNWLAVVLTVWLFCGGIIGMLGHQLLDCHNDKTAGVSTFVTEHGAGAALRLCVVCASVLGAMILTPLAFVPVPEAVRIAGLLLALSSVYAIKGMRALRKLRSGEKVQGLLTRPAEE